MSIPKWEMDNLTQPELLGKWTKDDTCAGLYGQRVRQNFTERMLVEQQRRKDRREAGELVQTFEEKLTEAPSTQRQILVSGKRRKSISSQIEWVDAMPPGTPHFAEIASGPRTLHSLQEAAVISQKPVEDSEHESEFLDVLTGPKE